MPFLERDIAGVLVATTLGTQARTPIGWIADTVPEYQVGEMEGEEPYLFTGIRGARQMSDGRVLVLDEGSCEFASSARMASSWSGPAEAARVRGNSGVP